MTRWSSDHLPKKWGAIWWSVVAEHPKLAFTRSSWIFLYLMNIKEYYLLKRGQIVWRTEDFLSQFFFFFYTIPQKLDIVSYLIHIHAQLSSHIY